MARRLGEDDYHELLLLRTGLRRFLRQSEDWAREAGLTPAQHQLMLTVRGHDDPAGPTISDVAGYLLLRHHSVVELVDRAAAAGLLARREDPSDARVVRLALTPEGETALAQLSALHLDELARLADRFRPLWHDLGDGEGPRGPRARPPRVELGRVYDPPGGTAHRILVDRLWPRGLHRQDASFEWRRHLAPSAALRRWYGHDPTRYEEFAQRYAAELNAEHAVELADLAALARISPVVLLTATRDVATSAAAVLATELRHTHGRDRRAQAPDSATRPR